MSELGIVHPQALTQEQWSAENAVILGGLTDKTRELLDRRKASFKLLLNHLISEETLSGKQLRDILSHQAA